MMNVIVVGCGRVGSTLAYNLFKAGHRVTVVDQSAAAFHNLPADFVGRMVEGDVLTRDVLRRAGLEQAEGLAAVTSSDSVNAVVAHIARMHYHVPHVVARNYDPRWRTLLEAFNLQLVSSASWSAQRVEELLSGTTLRILFSVGNAEIEVYELPVPDRWHGRSLRDLLPWEDCRAVALTRAGRALLPSSDLILKSGDVLCLSATLEGIAAVRRRLEGEEQEE
jgi:trk system potassium uptake protein TrkA